MTFYFVLFSLICIFAIVYGQRVKAMLRQKASIRTSLSGGGSTISWVNNNDKSSY